MIVQRHMADLRAAWAGIQTDCEPWPRWKGCRRSLTGQSSVWEPCKCTLDTPVPVCSTYNLGAATAARATAYLSGAAHSTRNGCARLQRALGEHGEPCPLGPIASAACQSPSPTSVCPFTDPVLTNSTRLWRRLHDLFHQKGELDVWLATTINEIAAVLLLKLLPQS